MASPFDRVPGIDHDAQLPLPVRERMAQNLSDPSTPEGAELSRTIEAILSSAQYADQGVTAEVPLTAAGGLATTIVMPPTLRADSLIELLVYGEFNAVGSDFEMWIEVFEGDSQLIRKYTSSAPGQYLLPLAVGVQARVGPGSTLTIRAGRTAGTGGFLTYRTSWTLKSIAHR